MLYIFVAILIFNISWTRSNFGCEKIRAVDERSIVCSCSYHRGNAIGFTYPSKLIQPSMPTAANLVVVCQMVDHQGIAAKVND